MKLYNEEKIIKENIELEADSHKEEALNVSDDTDASETSTASGASSEDSIGVNDECEKESHEVSENTESTEDTDSPEKIAADEYSETDEVKPDEIEEESDVPETEKVPSSSLPYHERYYLRYNNGKRTTPLDLDGTRAFLVGIGFDGGELKKARIGKDYSENYKSNDKNKNNQIFCSYCGTEIAGVEFYRLPDGRTRCTTCSGSVVKSKAEVEEIFSRVLSNLENFFGATIDVSVSVQVLDERKLKKKIGVPLGTKDDGSMLILGVAVNKKKNYSILLENAAPRISLIATFAHELTHIWQYTHWDNNKHFKKCSKGKRLLIYEGMAKWAEIQYLYLVGETNAAKREEYLTMQRQDEYGIGFRLYVDKYPLSKETMSCDDTPFTPDSYPSL